MVLILVLFGLLWTVDQHSIHGGTCCIGEMVVEFDIGLMKEMARRRDVCGGVSLLIIQSYN